MTLKISVKFCVFFIIASIIKLRYAAPKTKNGILLIKADGIGDYILFRNLIPFYTSYFAPNPVTFLCTTAVKDLTKNVDKDIVSEYIYVDIQKYSKKISYVFEFLKFIRQQGFEIVIQPTYSRSNILDCISFVSGAIKTFTFKGDLNNSNIPLRYISKFLYTDIIPSPAETMFEFNRMKEFTSVIVKKEINLKRPSLFLPEFKNEPYAKDPFIVLFPGSSQPITQWPIEKFTATAQFLSTNYSHKIIVCGSGKETILGNIIAEQLPQGRVINLCGKTTLTQFSQILRSSSLLISNDTVAIHLAASLNTPFICISTGRHFGRYTPYPTSMNIKSRYVYPDSELYNEDKFQILAERYKYHSKNKITDISINKVTENINKMLIYNNQHEV